MAGQSTFTYELTNDQQEILLGVMAAGNYRRREVPYALWSIEGDHVNATLYEKERHGLRKLCVQGSKARDFIEFTLEPQVLGAATLGYEDVLDPTRLSPHAGSDESGKGDFFGPLVVCCAYADGTQIAAMREMGVKDCKQMTDAAVRAVGARLRAQLGPNGYAVVKIGPAAYNRLYARIQNINRLLAWAHGTAIEELLTKRPDCPRVIVDQFAPTEATIRRALKERGRRVTVEQHHKAERDIVVAAASVIARELFLRDMAAMSEEVYGPPAEGRANMPIGSSDPRVRQVAEDRVRAAGPVWLMNHAKAHFQTTDKVLAACGLSRDDLPPEGRVVSSAARRDLDEQSTNKTTTNREETSCS